MEIEMKEKNVRKRFGLNFNNKCYNKCYQISKITKFHERLRSYPIQIQQRFPLRSKL